MFQQGRASDLHAIVRDLIVGQIDGCHGRVCPESFRQLARLLVPQPTLVQLHPQHDVIVRLETVQSFLIPVNKGMYLGTNTAFHLRTCSMSLKSLQQKIREG